MIFIASMSGVDASIYPAYYKGVVDIDHMDLKLTVICRQSACPLTASQDSIMSCTPELLMMAYYITMHHFDPFLECSTVTVEDHPL